MYEGAIAKKFVGGGVGNLAAEVNIKVEQWAFLLSLK